MRSHFSEPGAGRGPIAIVLLLLISALLAGITPVFSQSYNSVVITEIMADPTPVVGLPDAEYIELLNRGNAPVSLKGWRLGTALLPDSVIAPNSYILICAKAKVSLLSSYGKVAGLSSFSLNNTGATLTLRGPKGQLVFSIAYKDTWWPAGQRAGGYALEMVDPGNPCGEAENWRVSVSPSGGTPGRPNSVAAFNPDLRPPVAERVEVVGDHQVVVYFTERLDSLASIQSGIYELKGRTITQKAIDSPGFRTLSLQFATPLVAGQRYELRVGNSTDCAGNRMEPATFALGLPVRADSGDVILNEILFNPRSGGVEFVEIYNRTQNYISLKNWSIGTIKGGVYGSFKPISVNDLLLAPNEFMALSVDSKIVAEQYPTDRSRTLITVPSLPTFVNEAGGVVLRDANGRIFDAFAYEEDFHSPLISDPKGVSLERIYPEKYGNDPANWQSASSLAGFATPGYGNSQSGTGRWEDEFRIEPEAFSPNNDGQDDFTTIRYTLSGPGRVGSVRIYDVQGRLVRDLVRNGTIGTEGSIRWDGTDTSGQMVRTGYYLILIDTFDAAGHTLVVKKRVVVAHP